jgi:alpha-ketoglutarate-dependent taurine dioxygenase
LGETTVLKTIDLKPKIGSEVTADPAKLLSGELADELRALLVRRGVLVFRDLDFTPDEQRQFTATLGDLRLGDFKKEGEGGLQKVTLDPKVNPDYAKFFPGTFFWHMDGTYDPIPPFATTLRPAVLSQTGGQTDFASTYAAYEDLSEEDKALIADLKVVHSLQAAMFHSIPDASAEEIAVWCSYPTPSYPLVWTHNSGRKSLVLSTSGSHIEGMHPVDSYELLQRLMDHATQPQYVYRHDWRMNDMVMWDNTGTMHRVRPYPADSGRLLHRFTLNGVEPIRAAA